MASVLLALSKYYIGELDFKQKAMEIYRMKNENGNVEVNNNIYTNNNDNNNNNNNKNHIAILSNPKAIKELFSDFLSGLTLHGFRFLFEGSRLRRFIWFCITTSVFSFSIILFHGLFTDFLLRKTMVCYETI